MTATKTAAKKKPAKKKTAAPKKPAVLKALNFKQLVARVAKSDKFPSLLRTAAQTGMLVSEQFLSKMTDEEHEEIKKLYQKHTEAKKAEVEDVSNSIPQEVGVMVANSHAKGKKTILSSVSGNLSVAVDTELFLTLRKRHPDTNIYFSSSNPETSPVTLSDQTGGAVLSVIAK